MFLPKNLEYFVQKVDCTAVSGGAAVVSHLSTAFVFRLLVIWGQINVTATKELFGFIKLFNQRYESGSVSNV